MFYKEGSDGSGGSSGSGGGGYVGYSFADAIKSSMKDLKIKDGSQESALFVTMVGEEIGARENKSEAKANPAGKIQCARGSREGVRYQRRG